MNHFCELIYSDREPPEKDHSREIFRTIAQNKHYLFDSGYSGSEQPLSEVVYEIQKYPGLLTAHLQRIYYCYWADLADPLYAALVDFLIVLNKRGKAISRRMITGTASKLSDQQRTLLNAALNGEIEDVSTIEGNCFSIFSRGLVGSVNLIEKLNGNDPTDHDPLQLAQDAVEYFQLDEAMTILERAIAENPERLELHEALLELYKSTRNRARFEKSFVELLDLESFTPESEIPETWSRLNDYFEHQ